MEAGSHEFRHEFYLTRTRDHTLYFTNRKVSVVENSRKLLPHENWYRHLSIAEGEVQKLSVVFHRSRVFETPADDRVRSHPAENTKIGKPAGPSLCLMHQQIAAAETYERRGL